MSTVAQRLSRAVAEEHISLVELAERAQLSRSSVQRYASDSTKEIPAAKLSKMAEVLHLPNDYLLGVRAFENWDAIDHDRNGFLCAVKEQMGEKKFSDISIVLYDVNPEDPYSTALKDFTSFIYDLVQTAEIRNGLWVVRLKHKLKDTTNDYRDVITDDQIKAAFFNGADPTLTKEEQDAMWDEAKAFIDFKIQQRKRKEN